MVAPHLKTKRLLLRHWKEDDLLPFAAINADERVMEFFPAPLSRKESDDLARRIQKELQEKDYGLWAVETLENKQFIGFAGLHYHDFPAHFTPCIELGWRLAYEAWRKGYGTEASLEILHYAFHILNLSEIVSFTSEKNFRSRKLMEKLGMTSDPKDSFEHPKLPEKHPLRKHVLYRLSQEEFFSRTP
ncbi:MAG: hypothetical protein KR126chlam3_01646 [Chlamydiae bacterium]|nr:hypothetical protein [Chlamydiota bacterium]